MNSRNLLLFVLLAIFITACADQTGGLDEAAVRQIVDEALTEQAAEQAEGIFLHISAGPDDPHRVLMPLQMAAMMMENRDVLVYFDIDAVKTVLKTSTDITYEQFPSSKTQLQKLMDGGVPLYVCPGCLEAAGYTPEDVMEGVQIAERDKLFAFTEGRILTLDY
jgi:predicted peroxiredoxin